MPQVTVTVTPGAGVVNTLVHIDDTDVSAGGKFTVATGKHSLHWWYAGNSGSTLAMSVAPVSGGGTLQVSDVISPPDLAETGDKDFTV
jgi:hypothetical protein